MIIIGKSSGMPLGTIKKLRNLLRSPKDYIRLQGGRGDTQKITLYYKEGSILMLLKADMKIVASTAGTPAEP